MSNIVIIIYLAIIGISLGSFVNAAVWRLRKHKDIVKDRSECIHCHHKLSWKDLIPVLSWLILRGKCRYCKKPISAQYPLVEIAVALFFVGSYVFWPTELSAWQDITLFILWLVYGTALAVLFVYDLRWYLLPDRITYPLVIVGLVYAVIRINSSGLGFSDAVFDIIYSLMAIGGFYWILHMVSKGQWVGFGDVKLGLSMGLVLGWQQAILALMAANVIGLLVILPGLLTGKLTKTSRIPFGPFLIAGFVIAGLFGWRIINWYLSPFPL